MDCLISIIVPVYKVEPYLQRCIESIRNQTYKKIEIILVDDGSPDRCPDICDELAEKDSRIQVIHKINGGLSDARNAGIEIATGEYIVFVDSDDYLAEQMIEKMLDAVQQNNCKMAICNFLCIDEEGKSTGESERSPVKDELLDAREILRRFYQLYGWFYIVAWNKLYHRSLLSKDTFPIGRIHEDEFTASQLIWKAEKIACIEYQGYYYVRQREGSITQNLNDSRHLDAYFALIERYKFYQEVGYTELLFETRARIYELLKKYYRNPNSYDEEFKNRISYIWSEYNRFTDLTIKERWKWKLFKLSPSLFAKVFN